MCLLKEGGSEGILLMFKLLSSAYNQNLTHNKNRICRTHNGSAENKTVQDHSGAEVPLITPVVVNRK